MNAASPTLSQRWWTGPAIVTAVAIAMLIWTWGTWIDVLIDFGVQLYVPWRLIHGQVLYRDIAHYTGPLSVYFNALAFEINGASLLTLVIANLPVLIAIVALVYYLALKLGGRLCATVCGLTLVTIFAFGHLTLAGNYNYVCPYEYEYTHATLFCLAGVLFLWRWLQTQQLRYSALAGLMAGLVFLTRSEFFVAIAGASGMAMLLSIIDRTSWAHLLRGWGLILFVAAVPVAVSVGLLSCAMPLRIAVRGTLGMWPAMLKGAVASQRFYQRGMGIDDLSHSLKLIAIWAGIYAAIIAIYTVWATLAKRKKGMEHAMIAGLAGFIAAGTQWNNTEEWRAVFRPLPLVTLIVIVVAFGRAWRRRPSDSQRLPALAAIFATLAFVLLGKIFFNARVYHYGFTLAMPAAMLLTICFFGWIPAWLRGRGSDERPFIGGMLGVWSIVILVHLIMTHTAIAVLQTEVGSGPDAFLAAEPRAGTINRSVGLTEKIVPPDATLACLPEGIMINYLARRCVPTPYVNYNPPDLLLFGESNMLASLRQHPPDYVFIVHKDTTEFGVHFFGQNYGQSLYAWVRENYVELSFPLDLGSPPLRDNRFGVRLMVRKTPAIEPQK